MPSLHFLYHELRPVRSRYSYVIACQEFEAHCELFAQLQRHTKQGWLRPEITFDDGHLSDAQYALPVLERYGLKATFFITAGWTGTRPEFMTFAELRELHAAGHTIGAHGLTHKLLTACSDQELVTELSTSRQILQDGLGHEIRVMSLPGGRANQRVLRACAEASYGQVFTSNPRAEVMEDGPKLVGRLNLHAGTSAAWLESVLDVQTGTLSRLNRAQRIKATAQQLLGDRLYGALWALGNRHNSESADLEAA